MGAKLGVEETCTGIDYVPGTLWLQSGGFVWRDDTVILQQQTQGDDLSIPLGDGDLDPGETVTIDMTFQVADSLAPGTVAGPQFIVTAESPDTVLVPWDLGVSPTEIVVAEPTESFVTAEDFETAVRDILGRIEGVANKTKDTAEKTLDTVVEDLDPWDQSPGWFIRWGGFGALASFVAGAVLPFTFWRALAWLRERRQRRKNPYFAAPATPPAWRSPGQWRAAAGQVSEPLVAALRRVCDWIDGLRRR